MKTNKITVFENMLGAQRVQQVKADFECALHRPPTPAEYLSHLEQTYTFCRKDLPIPLFAP